MNIVTITEASNTIGCRPRDISDAFYMRWFDPAKCPMLGNRRVIPRELLPELRQTLIDHGRIRVSQPAAISA